MSEIQQIAKDYQRAADQCECSGKHQAAAKYRELAAKAQQTPADDIEVTVLFWENVK
jgi:hypothetical protein